MHRFQVAAHARLVGDDEGVLGVALSVAPVGAGGVVDGASGDVEDLLTVVGHQRDHQRGPARVEIDRPGHRVAVAQLQHIGDQLQQHGLIVVHPP